MSLCKVNIILFFFQAEEGIRDDLVTGVQTCALPIYQRHAPQEERLDLRPVEHHRDAPLEEHVADGPAGHVDRGRLTAQDEIGRASCRERAKISAVAVSLKKKKKTKPTWQTNGV